MKIKLTDDRGIWFDGKQREAGYETTVSDSDGEKIIAAGMAVKIESPKAKPAKAAKKNAD